MRLIIALSALFSSMFLTSAVAEVNVVTTIRPVHSLVSAVMQGAGTPYLIVKQTGSPHTYSLKPSDAKALGEAKLIFWVGEELETFLKKSIDSLGQKAEAVALVKTPGIKLLPYREEGHGKEKHDDHHEDKHDDHHGDKHKAKHKDKHDDHHGDKHDDKHDDHHSEKHEAKHKEKHDDHHHHHGDGPDMHIWLSADNAAKIAEFVEQKLSKADPKNQAIYKKNLKALLAKLKTLNTELGQLLKPKKDVAIIVFHDSYQYFEKAYDLEHVIPVTVNPEIQLSARRILELSKMIKKDKVRCLFLEPQFKSGAAERLAKNFKLPTGILDPLGSAHKSGPELYFEMMQSNAKAIANCS